MFTASFLFKFCGVVGLLLITRGIFVKKETTQDWIFAAGGLCLLAYSAFLRDPIFIILQIIFTASSLYEIYRLRKEKGQLPMPINSEETARLLDNNDQIS